MYYAVRLSNKHIVLCLVRQILSMETLTSALFIFSAIVLFVVQFPDCRRLAQHARGHPLWPILDYIAKTSHQNQQQLDAINQFLH